MSIIDKKTNIFTSNEALEIALDGLRMEKNKKRKKMSSKSTNLKDFDISVLAHIHQYYHYDIQDYETMNWLGIFRVAFLLTD